MSRVESFGGLRQRWLDIEEWRDIPGYEGRYQASDMGSIRCLARTEIDSLGRRKPIRANICKQYCLSTGYPAVNMPAPIYGGTKTKRKRRTVRVHTLVMLTFVGPRPPDMFVLHNNGRKQDNRRKNLRYGTPAENNADALKHGAIKFGTDREGTKLTEERVAAIRGMAGRASDYEMAFAFEVSSPSISRARNGHGWPHVEALDNPDEAFEIFQRAKRSIVIRATLPVLVAALSICRTRALEHRR